MASSSTTIPFFRRAWRITVDTADGSRYVVRSLVGAGEEPLRVTFAIDTYALLAYWTAEVVIYNLRAETKERLAQGAPNSAQLWQFNQPVVAGDTVTISAGYESGIAGDFDADASVVYSGHVLQVAWTRENVVDYRLTLRCVTGLMEDAFNFASFSLPSGATAYDALNQLCAPPPAGSNLPIEIDDAAAKKLSDSKFPRSQAVHGRPYEIIRQITKQHDLMAWVSPRGLNVRSFDPSSPLQSPDYSYGPPDLPGPYTTGGTQQGLVKKTLLGVPEQTQDGVVFRVLLDSGVKIGDVVQLAPGTLAPGTLINLYPVQIGSLPPAPSHNGLYVVAGVRHFGDSRGHGESWYTEITGVVMDFFADFLQARSPLG